MKPSSYLPLMQSVARDAGRLAMAYSGRVSSLEVTFKGQADLLCEADGEVEKLIFRALGDAQPDIAFQGEEFGDQGPRAAMQKWAVDPIDGTTNFLSGLHFAISIALVRENEPIAGVIYDPMKDEMFSAASGAGATLNGKKTVVRRQDDIARLVVGTGLPLDRHVFSANAYDRLHRIREAVAAVRVEGSCALSLAHVACGRLDGYFEGPTGFLDFAAGVVILREAGGIVTDFWGTDAFIDNVTTTTGAPRCHAFLQSITNTAITEAI